jgi:hypothetical protein
MPDASRIFERSRKWRFMDAIKSESQTGAEFIIYPLLDLGLLMKYQESSSGWSSLTLNYFGGKYKWTKSLIAGLPDVLT